MSTSAAKTLANKKVKRQKQIVAVGSVILLALLGFELPKMLGGGSSETAAPAPTTAAQSVPGSPLAAAPGGLPDTDHVVIDLDSGQLLSFGLFKSKDPFVQQLSTNPGALPSAPPPTAVGPGATTPGETTPGETTPTPVPPPVTTTSPTTTPGSTVPIPPAGTTPTSTTPVAPVAPTSVAISTNGACETVELKGTFPGDEDIFRVVWIARDGKSVKISVVGGAYDSGQAAATLMLGEKLTLVNTADGTRYVILLKSKCDVQPAPAPAPAASTTTTATTTTSATTTVTTTATTPIVTDSLDTTTPTG
jgi:hypothetical protein